MKRPIGSAALIVSCIFAIFELALADDGTVPEAFRKFDDSSTRTINYDNLSDILRAVVVEVSSAGREMADPASDITGTRMKSKVNRLTGNDGNRFLYESFQDNERGQQYLREIQATLERLPSEIPLENFSRDEQLAYWLNLYNITVLNEIIAVYPKRNLKKLIHGRNSVFSQKLLTIADIPLSLDDIQFKILRYNYNGNPLVIYGLYQGIIGGPDIRASAYTGHNVYNQLEENAFNFINSNRGTFYRDEKSPFRVSAFYDANRMYFPDFDADLEQHLLQYLEGRERAALQATTGIRADITDWSVTDLVGTQQRIGGSLANNQAAMLDAYRSNRRSANGGIMVAPVVVKATEKDDESEKDEAVIENRKSMPVEGAVIEDITPDQADTTD